MRVLHVIDHLGLGGGAEHSLVQILPRLEERGVRSRVVCLIDRHGGLQETVREAGFEVAILGGTGFTTWIPRLRREIRRWRPDVVHATLFNACQAARVASLGLGVRRVDSLVNTSYAEVRTARLGVPSWKLATIRALDRATARFLGGEFHVLTEAVERVAVEDLGIPPERVTRIPRGRSREALGRPGAERRRAVRRRLGIGEDTELVLTVGRQDPQKGQVHLVRAVPEILRRRPGARVLVAGREGTASAELETEIARLGLEDAVHLLGHRSDVPDLLSAADLFVFPSLYEGLGCAVLEALGLEVPVVASDVPAIREVLDGVGVLVPAADPGALTEAVTDLLADGERRRHLAAAGRRRFEERYTLDRVAGQTVDLYRRLLPIGVRGEPSIR